MKIKCLILSVFTLCVINTALALTAIEDTELAGIQGQGDTIGIILDDVAINKDGDGDLTISLDLDQFSGDDELIIHDLKWVETNSNNGFIWGTTDDPIILGDINTTGDDRHVITFSFPRFEESYQRTDLSVALSSDKASPNYFAGIGLNNFIPWTRKRSIDGNDALAPVQTSLSLWAADNGVNIVGDIAFRGNIELKNKENPSYTNKIELVNADIYIPLGIQNINNIEYAQPMSMITDYQNGTYYFNATLADYNPNVDPPIHRGHIIVDEMIGPGINGPRTFSLPNNDPFIKISGLQVYQLKIYGYSN